MSFEEKHQKILFGPFCPGCERLNKLFTWAKIWEIELRKISENFYEARLPINNPCLKDMKNQVMFLFKDHYRLFPPT